MSVRRFLVPFLLFALAVPARAELEPGAQFAVAIEQGSLAKVMALVEGGHDVDTGIEYVHTWTPLMKASWEGALDIAEYLVAKGANVNYVNQDGESPLHMAIGRGQVDVVKLLLAHGAKVDQADSRQFLPLHKAAAAGHVEIVQALVKAKAPINPEMYGLTPLMFSVSAGNGEMVKALVALGADVNYASKANQGQTAIFSAIQTANAEMLSLLLELGANPNVKMKDGKTPLMAAQDGDQDDLIVLLKAAGAKK